MRLSYERQSSEKQLSVWTLQSNAIGILNASDLWRGHDRNTGVKRLARINNLIPSAYRTNGWYTAGILSTPVHIFFVILSTLVSNVGKDSKNRCNGFGVIRIQIIYCCEGYTYKCF